MSQVANWQQRQRVRRAVIVGQSEYPSPNSRLPGCKQDAESVYQKFTSELGFEKQHTSLLIDGSRRKILEAVDNMVEQMGGSDVVVFYFSGHGAEKNGYNFLCTVDGERINVHTEVIQPINQKGLDAIVLMFLDCCRHNADDKVFKGDGALDEKLQRLKLNDQNMVAVTVRSLDEHQSQFCIGYGCDPGSVSVESNGQGVFTRALLQHVADPVIFQEMTLDVKNSVLATKHQRCWFNDALTQKFSLSWGDVSTSGSSSMPCPTTPGRDPASKPVVPCVAAVAPNIPTAEFPAKPTVGPPSAAPEQPCDGSSKAIRCTQDLHTALQDGRDKVIDLQGRTISGPLLAGQVQLSLLEGCTLRNGNVHLPDGVQLQAFEGSSSLQQLFIKGGGTIAVVAVACGGNLDMSSCQFTNSTGMGLMVSSGSSATCRDCTALKCASSGFLASGSGAVLEILDGCRAQEGGQDGFQVQSGGKLVAANKTTADSNQRHGFAAIGKGSVLTVGASCVAQTNGGSGFAACHGGLLNIGSSGEAVSNAKHGFKASNSSKLSVGDSCFARKNGIDGFSVYVNSSLLVGEECEAISNKSSGFSSSDSSNLTTDRFCIAMENGKSGYQASNKATLVAVSSCAAVSNGGVGFSSSAGSHLTAGMYSISKANRNSGFGADCTATLEVGDNSESTSNKESGFLSSNGSKLTAGSQCVARSNKFGFHSEASLSTGDDCMAEENTLNGFFAFGGGTLQVGANSTASCNDSGFLSQGEGSVMTLGTGCKAVGNSGGVSAYSGGHVNASGCSAEGNKSHDWLNDSKSTVLGGPKP